MSDRESLKRCELRLAKVNEDRNHWRERAIAAEQALALFGSATMRRERSYRSPYCDEATDSGHSSASGLGA